MPTMLLTGAGGGIGFELARQYAADGWQVIATCRNAEAAGRLTALPGDVSVERLDVTDRAAVDALATRLEGRPIDLLYLNAGINPQPGASLAETDFDIWPQVFDVNVIAPLYMAARLVDNVAASERKLIVAMGSMAGSFVRKFPGNYIYRSSKAALHNAVKALADDLADRGVSVVVMHPGQVSVPRMPNNPVAVEDSAAGIRRTLSDVGPAKSGRFLDYLGEIHAW
ncbi:MAG: SDR family NAD(P)-dependent oxidoreductase [Alphaproteobacteria bacterium]